jgi:hypothetical protein
VPARSGRTLGCHLTTLFGTDAVPTAAVIQAAAVPAIKTTAASKRRGWLPLLTVLFLISYGLMTMLIVEQGRTIESQRALIRELFRDSTELSAIKKAAQESAQTSSAQTPAQENQVQDIQVQSNQTPSSQALSNQTLSTQTPSTQIPSTRTQSTQTPSAQIPSKQAPTSQAPSSQAGPKPQRAQNQSDKQKPAFRMPSKPEPDLIDDVRTLIVI